eukprot:g14305.t1
MPLNLVRRNANHNVCKVWSEAAPRKAQEAARRQSMAEEFLQLVHRGARFDKRSVKADDKLFKPHATEIKSDSSDTAFKDNLDFFDCDATGGDHIGQAESERDNTPALKKKTVDEPRKGKDSIQRKEKESTQKTKSFALGDRNEVNSIRRKYGLHVQGTDVADPILQFSEMLRLGVPEWMLKNLTRDKPEGCGFTDPTSIQKQAIPILLSGRDLLACAPTGSGKTAAFSVPILSSLKAPKNVGLRALILSPTRELAEQIFRHFKLLSKRKKFKMFMLSKSNANSSMWGREGSKRRDLLVATPMRLVHLLRNHALDLSGVQWLFLDEADRLFEMGFLDQVDEILAACTYPKLQRAMFSATMPQGVETLARTVLRDPIRVTVGHRNAAAHSVKQRLLFVGKEQGKLIAFRQLVQEGLNLPVLVFVQSKDRGEQLFRELVYDGLHVDVIHSQRTRLQRENIIKQFRAGELWVLICTDLMARGIDFAGVNCVVNYDFPQSVVSYIHRIGRTGRAGREGEAITFFTESDKPMLKGVARVIKHAGRCSRHQARRALLASSSTQGGTFPPGC